MQTTTTKTTKMTKASKPAAAKKPAKPKPKPKQPAPAPAAPAGLAVAIPLDKLAHDPANVRVSDAGPSDELAASIAAHGVIQPLTVRPEVKEAGGKPHPTGRYLVTAGGRRLRALLKLANQKRLPKDAGVPCVIRAKGGEAEAREVSLAENVERLPMNPADEHAAFAALADAGMGSGDIAARFGIHKRRVEQRLALGRIAPDLLDELRKGTMNAGQAQALTLTADHERQRQAWRQCQGGYNADVQMRRLLTETAMGFDNPLMRLVGRDAYAAAGGTVRVDLFSGHEQDEGFAEDAALVRRLAGEKLDAEAEAARAEGWAFAVHELQPDADPYAYRREQAERRGPTKDERERADRIGAELEGLDEQGWTHDTPEGREVGERFDRLSAELDALEAGREEWTAEQRARCGVFVCVGRTGTIERRCGLVDPAWERKQAEERRRAMEEATAAATAGGGNTVTEEKPAKEAEGVELSRALVWRLTKARTEALRASMVQNPAAAADLLIAHLCERLFFRVQFASRDPLPLEVSLDAGRDDFCAATGRATPERGSTGLDRPTEAQGVFFDALQAWRSRLPQTPDALPAFVAGLTPEDKTGLLALLSAASVNTVVETADPWGGKGNGSVGRVAAFVGCDIRQWWKPTAESVFTHMTKAGIAAAVAEALPDEPAKAAALADAKKADAAARAEALVKETDWLPLPLRPAHHPRPTEGPAGQPAAESAEPMKLAA